MRSFLLFPLVLGPRRRRSVRDGRGRGDDEVQNGTSGFCPEITVFHVIDDVELIGPRTFPLGSGQKPKWERRLRLPDGVVTCPFCGSRLALVCFLDLL